MLFPKDPRPQAQQQHTCVFPQVRSYEQKKKKNLQQVTSGNFQPLWGKVSALSQDSLLFITRIKIKRQMMMLQSFALSQILFQHSASIMNREHFTSATRRARAQTGGLTYQVLSNIHMCKFVTTSIRRKKAWWTVTPWSDKATTSYNPHLTISRETTTESNIPTGNQQKTEQVFGKLIR